MTTKQYIVTLDAIRSKYEGDCPPSWIRITTITMLGKFNQTISIQTIRDSFANGPIRMRRRGTHTNGFEWSLRETTFYNQVTLSYFDNFSNKSIKVFPNGSFQVAGCSDRRDCRRIVQQLTFFLKHIESVSGDLESEPFRVVMINTNFSLNSPVDLAQVMDVLSGPKYIVSFNPDRYSAVKVKFCPAENTKQVTASIFSTGKIIVTGAETLKEIALAYEILNEKLRQTRIPGEVKTEDTFDKIKGIAFKEIVAKLKLENIKRF